MLCMLWLEIGVSKKTKKPRKPEKNRKNWTVKKNRLNRLKFWKNRPVRFYKPKTKKTKLNRTRTEKNRTEPNRTRTEKNRAKPVWTGFCPKKPNGTEIGRFEPVLVFVLKNFDFVTFFDKNRIEQKIITPN